MTDRRPNSARRAVLLCRQSVSDDDDRDSLSIRSQESELRAWADRQDWTVVAVLKEQDVKGWWPLAQRPGITEAIRLARAGEYDVLGVWDLSRLARSVLRQEEALEALALAGVEIASMHEPWVSGSPMLRVILGAVAEERTRDVRRHVNRAIHARVAAGAWHGRPPMGYRVLPKAGLVVVEELAIIVREVAARIAAGESYPRIAADLNARGIPSPDGARWHPTTVRNIGTCRTYTGASWIGDLVAEGAHEALIGPETWDRIQRRLSSPERAPRGASVPTFLTGALRCGCGAKMYPVRFAKRRGEKVYQTVLMRCGAVRCDAPRRSIALHAAEEWVIDRLGVDLAAVVPWRAAYDGAVRARRESMPEAAEAERRLRARLRAVEATVARIDAAGRDGVLPTAEWGRQRRDAEADVAAVLAALAAVPPPPDPERFRSAAVACRELARLVVTGDAATLRRALALVGARITLGAEGLEIAYGDEFAWLLDAGRES
jgi:site-specific DNA recombinase